MNVKPATDVNWRTLYRNLVRAAPGAVSGKRKATQATLAKIRQGFEENKNAAHTDRDRALLYERGHNTLIFLKLARELESVERHLVSAILAVQAHRRETEEKPPISRRRLQPLQRLVYSETFDEYDKAIASIESDLGVLLPRDRISPSLSWIPPLKNLHIGNVSINKV
ncbi:hypothetical protein GGI05_002635 [Coemansia sp. RSA 2603]|nr:hypothetical protein GGI05_002635 [Coemansia sp. RSA 2603]